MFSKQQDIKVNYPSELLTEMNVEGVFISPIDKRVGITALSNNKNNSYILRLYSIVQNQVCDNDTYELIYELEAFSMSSRSELMFFLDKLPMMSAFELLLILNPPQNIAKH